MLKKRRGEVRKKLQKIQGKWKKKKKGVGSK